MPPKQRALEKQLQNELERQKKAEEDAEREEAAAWSVGAKSNSKSKAEEEKDLARRQKAAEKAALEVEEAEELSGIARKVKTKKKGKDDFDMLKAALAQQPKTKAQKEAEAKKAADEERRRKEEIARQENEARKQAEQEQIRKAAARGIVMNHAEELMVPINNRLEDDDYLDLTGLDAALDVVGSRSHDEKHPERRQKALYNAYFENMLPVLKEEMPGLKLSQYKERIFDMWKSAPENPHNQG